MNGVLVASQAFSQDLLVSWRSPEFLEEASDGRRWWHDAVLRDPVIDDGNFPSLEESPVIGVHIYMDGPEGIFQVRTYGFDQRALVQPSGAREVTIRLFEHAPWLSCWGRPLDCAHIPAKRQVIVVALHAGGIRVRHVFNRP
jgi:hypothetical protein